MLMSPKSTLKNRPSRREEARDGRTGRSPGLLGAGGGGGGRAGVASDRSGTSCSSAPSSSWCAGVAMPPALYPEARERQIRFAAVPLHGAGDAATVPHLWVREQQPADIPGAPTRLPTTLSASPRPQSERLQRIEFLPLREGRALAVLVAQSGAVHNRLSALQQPLSAGQLEHAANYLNSLIANRTLAEARARLRTELERDGRELGELQARALALGAEAV